MNEEGTTYEVVKKRETKHGLVELRSDGILVFRPDLTSFKQYDLQVLKDLRVHLIELSEGIPRLYMCDNRYVSILIGREEKQYVNDRFCDFATHCAMITSSPTMKVLLNGFNLLFKPKFEMRLFKTEAEAVEWLLNQDFKLKQKLKE